MSRWLVFLVLVALLSACGESGAAGELTPTPQPELRLTIDTRDVGPGRTDVAIEAGNVGSVDVLVVVSARLDANAGVDRNSGPTERATPSAADGTEIGGLTHAPKLLEWVPERLRSGSALTWSIAVRCLDENETSVVAEMRSTTVGSVREAEFEPISARLRFQCPPPRRPGQSSGR